MCKTCVFDDMCFRCYSRKNHANVQFFKDIIRIQQSQIQRLINSTDVNIPTLPDEYADFLIQKDA